MIERSLRIGNQLGLHARAAAQLVHTASRFPCRVLMIVDGDEVNAKSILGLLALGLEPEREVLIRCDGEREHDAMDALEQLFAAGFGEGAMHESA